MLNERVSGGAGAGEKATFSLTHGEARREKWGYVHLRKVVSASSGPSLDAGIPLSDGADAGGRFTAISCTAKPDGRDWVIRI